MLSGCGVESIYRLTHFTLRDRVGHRDLSHVNNPIVACLRFASRGFVLR